MSKRSIPLNSHIIARDSDGLIIASVEFTTIQDIQHFAKSNDFQHPITEVNHPENYDTKNNYGKVYWDISPDPTDIIYFEIIEKTTPIKRLKIYESEFLDALKGDVANLPYFSLVDRFDDVLYENEDILKFLNVSFEELFLTLSYMYLVKEFISQETIQDDVSDEILKFSFAHLKYRIRNRKPHKI